jgi:hypothetical protein
VLAHGISFMALRAMIPPYRGKGFQVRVFHFIDAKHGMDDLRRRRLKIARLHDLNDPFELLAQDLTHPDDCSFFLDVREKASDEIGFLCFSRTWHNPIMWTHYADRHRGICLGFDVPDDKCQNVRYSNERPNAIVSAFLRGDGPSKEQALHWLQTKFEGWNYEDEIRLICRLHAATFESGLYFCRFSHDELRLKEIILGIACPLPWQAVQDIAVELGDGVTVTRAQLAPRTFEVIAAAPDEAVVPRLPTSVAPQVFLSKVLRARLTG